MIPKIIIFIGLPGSGKGTQAKKLIAEFHYGHISTGDLLRALDTDPDGNLHDKEALQTMKSGGMVSNELIYKLAFSEMEKCFSEDRGVVLDGAIRNIDQAKYYQQFFVEKGLESSLRVFDVRIPDDVVFNSIRARIENDKARGKALRADDTPEKIKKRILEQGHELMPPILSYYKDMGVLVDIDGTDTIDGVEKQIRDSLEI